MDDVSIWLLEYGRTSTHARAASIYTAFNAGLVEVPYSYVLVRGRGHAFLVDTGCGSTSTEVQRTATAAFGVGSLQPPEVVLAEVGLTPADIDTILLTHMHFDHSGDVERFPNAVVYVQEREVMEWLRWIAAPPHLRFFNSSVDPANLAALPGIGADGRLRLVDGDVDDVLPGVHLRAAFDTHTFGCQWIHIEEEDGPGWALPGDNLLTYDNILGLEGNPVYHPIGYGVGSQINSMLTLDAMMRAVGDHRRIVPVHEPRVSDEFPCRVTDYGLRVTELALASGQRSYV
jgi:glyoxylase-like metal-dependent hydrolase (beta-lactamase superfamily II)